MEAELFWVNGPWPGNLALAARPRGGDWLSDEIAAWSRVGIETVLSLLTPEEEEELDLLGERREVTSRGMQFVALPIPDRHAPSSESSVTSALEKLDTTLRSGKNAVIHCRQGVGRSGLVAACLLVTKGLAPESAIGSLSAARGVTIPETEEQRQWIDRYAALAANTRVG